MENFKENVAQIIDSIGGKTNVQNATHCVTRLRLILHDQAQVDIEKLEENDLVKGSFLASGQFQVVIGPGLVDKVYKELVSQTGVTESSAEEIKEVVTEKKNLLQKAIRTLADIFIPILPAIVAAGLLMGLNNILSNPGIFFDKKSFLDVYSSWAGFAGIINVIANTAFTFLPALIGWSAVKKFGGNPVLGIVLGLVLVHPSLLSAYDFAADPDKAKYWNILGL